MTSIKPIYSLKCWFVFVFFFFDFLISSEYANDKKLQQDHPCVIQLIRDKYLRQPANKNLPYQLDHPEKVDSSDGQAKDIRNILKNKV